MEVSSKSMFIRASSTEESEAENDENSTIKTNSDASDDDTTTNCNILDVLNVISQYGLPSIDVLEMGEEHVEDDEPGSSSEATTRHHFRYAHTLGSGYSARVIRHSTSKDVILQDGSGRVVVTAGTVVALKKTLPTILELRPEDTVARDAVSKAYHSIYQEIKTCRHPYLRTHENISKLLYVAWQPDVPFPLIAMELAAFGTLEDVLTAAGEGPTLIQKINLTVDIALGIAALHRERIVHGDIKPANILVNRHAERQMVGQLADFGGSVDLTSGSHLNPTIRTTLWSAPEDIMEHKDIDWMQADIWTYGLVVASIWSHVASTAELSSSCYLNRILPISMDTTLKLAYLKILKTESDSSSGSLMSQCKTFMENVDPTTAKLVYPIIANTLSCHGRDRKNAEYLVSEYIEPLCQRTHRRSVHGTPL